MTPESVSTLSSHDGGQQRWGAVRFSIYAWDMGGGPVRTPPLVPVRADNAENMSDPRNEMNPNHKKTQDAWASRQRLLGLVDPFVTPLCTT